MHSSDDEGRGTPGVPDDLLEPENEGPGAGPRLEPDDGEAEAKEGEPEGEKPAPPPYVLISYDDPVNDTVTLNTNVGNTTTFMGLLRRAEHLYLQRKAEMRKEEEARSIALRDPHGALRALTGRGGPHGRSR